VDDEGILGHGAASRADEFGRALGKMGVALAGRCAGELNRGLDAPLVIHPCPSVPFSPDASGRRVGEHLC
jgi:hypothetical protein